MKNHLIIIFLLCSFIISGCQNTDTQNQFIDTTTVPATNEVEHITVDTTFSIEPTEDTTVQSVSDPDDVYSFPIDGPIILPDDVFE